MQHGLITARGKRKVDISQFQYMLEKAKGYGYRRGWFILDRGYFGKENIEYMDKYGYDFVIMMKGMKASIRELLLENRGRFENIRHSIRKYRFSGITVKRTLYEGDGKKRYLPYPPFDRHIEREV